MIPTTTTVKALLTNVAPEGDYCKKSTGKVSIIGAGTVGTAIAFTLLAQRICSELVLIDQNESLARGEMLDIQHATMYLDSPQISSSSEYANSRDSKIIIITAGTRNTEDKKELAIRQNVEIFKDIVPEVIKHSPDCILVVCSFPVDEMSYVAWKLSKLATHKVIGAGTILESARFRWLIAQKLGIQPNCCQAFIIGEHGSKSVPVWSSVSVAGVRLKDVNPNLGLINDPEDWKDIHQEVIDSANEVAELKECGSWGMALSIARIVKAILEDSKECYAVSTHIKGCRHGIDKDVFMSLPCIVGACGIEVLVKQNLNDIEKDQFQKSADRMYEIQKTLKLTDKDNKNNSEVDC